MPGRQHHARHLQMGADPDVVDIEGLARRAAIVEDAAKIEEARFHQISRDTHDDVDRLGLRNPPCPDGHGRAAAELPPEGHLAVGEVGRNDPAPHAESPGRLGIGSLHQIGHEVGRIDAVIIHHDDAGIGRLLRQRRQKLGRGSEILTPADLEGTKPSEFGGQFIGHVLTPAEARQVEHDAGGRQALAHQALQRQRDHRQPAGNGGERDDGVAA